MKLFFFFLFVFVLASMVSYGAMTANAVPTPVCQTVDMVCMNDCFASGKMYELCLRECSY